MSTVFGSYPNSYIVLVFRAVAPPTRKETRLKLEVYVDGRKVAESG